MPRKLSPSRARLGRRRGRYLQVLAIVSEVIRLSGTSYLQVVFEVIRPKARLRGR